MTKRTVKIGRIKISQEMSRHIPGVKKMRDKYYYYWKNKKLESNIVLDSHYVLKDGYTSYLLAKMFGLGTVDVEVEDNAFVKWAKKKFKRF